MLNTAGEFVVNETRKQVSGGADVPFVRNRAYWTGSAWFDCPDAGAVITAQAASPKRSVFCQTYVDEEIGYLRISLGGRLMSDVFNEIRNYKSTDAAGTFSWANWGTAPSRVQSA